MEKDLGLAGRLARSFINSKLTPLIIISAVVSGIMAIYFLPREVDPQIIVPIVDIFIRVPGASAKEVENRVTTPAEKILWGIPGVKFIYSASSEGGALITVRFNVGDDEQRSVFKVRDKLFANLDILPAGVGIPLVKLRSVNDVPFFTLTFWSDLYTSYDLRRVAIEVADRIKQIKEVSEAAVIGGEPRTVLVELNKDRMLAYNISVDSVIKALTEENEQYSSGDFKHVNQRFSVAVAGFLKSVNDVKETVVGVSNGRPVYLSDIATIKDGPGEVNNYVYFGAGPAFPNNELNHGSHGGIFPAITVSISKRRGTNAIFVSRMIQKKIEGLQESGFIPSNVHVSVTRNYGEIAVQKSNNLLFHMLLAIISVSLFIWIALGLREALIVVIAIPVPIACTLAVFYFADYTLNRATFFALIFSISILVDDAIVVVENIARHYLSPHNQDRPFTDVICEAVNEVGNPTVLATFAVIAAVLPNAFVSGLSGPYMRPTPVGASTAMLFSLLVAFIITPWASLRLLKKGVLEPAKTEIRIGQIYRSVMTRLIRTPLQRTAFLVLVVFLFIGACSLCAFKWVVLKILPYANKSQFQIIINMPASTTLEQTAAATFAVGSYLATVPDITDYEMYVGTASPYDLQGLVRQYYLRRGPEYSEIVVNLIPQQIRGTKTHAIVQKARPTIQKIAKLYGARVTIAEVPPGTPVLQDLVAEVYGPDYSKQIQVAAEIREVFERNRGISDIDWSAKSLQPEIRFLVDKRKAALYGVSVRQIVHALEVATQGERAGILHVANEKEEVPIILRFRREQRSSMNELEQIPIIVKRGNLVPIGEFVHIKSVALGRDATIYHKNMMPVVYVMGAIPGTHESAVYKMFEVDREIARMPGLQRYQLRPHFFGPPFSNQEYSFQWDGEWHVTYIAFRDMGIAFIGALLLIYLLLVGWFRSYRIPLAIMVAIPLSVVGIFPAHALFGAFFTATSMIGMTADAGIVARNSIILVDFIEVQRRLGVPLIDACIEAGVIRFRPMLLTSISVIVGAWVILFDPVFQGMALSLVGGEVAGLFLSRMVVPILYFMIEK